MDAVLLRAIRLRRWEGASGVVARGHPVACNMAMANRASHGGDGGDIGSKKSQHTIDAPTMSVAARDRSRRQVAYCLRWHEWPSAKDNPGWNRARKGKKRRLLQIDGRVECGRDNDGHPMPGDSWVRRRKPTKLKVRSTLQLRRNKKKINHGEASKRMVGSSPAATERGVQSLHAFVPFFLLSSSNLLLPPSPWSFDETKANIHRNHSPHFLALSGLTSFLAAIRRNYDRKPKVTHVVSRRYCTIRIPPVPVSPFVYGSGSPKDRQPNLDMVLETGPAPWLNLVGHMVAAGMIAISTPFLR